MIFGGLTGAVIISWLSDRYRRRVPFIVMALAFSSLGLVGITFATSYFLFTGFFIYYGFFPFKRRSDRVPIWCRNCLSCS